MYLNYVNSSNAFDADTERFPESEIRVLSDQEKSALGEDILGEYVNEEDQSYVEVTGSLEQHVLSSDPEIDSIFSVVVGSSVWNLSVLDLD